MESSDSKKTTVESESKRVQAFALLEFCDIEQLEWGRSTSDAKVGAFN